MAHSHNPKNNWQSAKHKPVNLSQINQRLETRSKHFLAPEAADKDKRSNRTTLKQTTNQIHLFNR